jgi:hypothetical protein
MALQEPGGQVTAELAGTLLALVEGDELVLILGIKHQVESGGGVGEEALAKFLAVGIGGGLRIVHDGYSWCLSRCNAAAPLSYPRDPRAGTRLHPQHGKRFHFSLNLCIIQHET